MKDYWLILGTLSVWRLTYMLNAEEGPWRIFSRIRERATRALSKKLFDCFFCLSIWVAAPFGFSIGEGWCERLLLILTLSAGAILVERFVSSKSPSPAANYLEDKEQTDVM